MNETVFVNRRSISVDERKVDCRTPTVVETIGCTDVKRVNIILIFLSGRLFNVTDKMTKGFEPTVIHCSQPAVCQRGGVGKLTRHQMRYHMRARVIRGPYAPLRGHTSSEHW